MKRRLTVLLVGFVAASGMAVVGGAGNGKPEKIQVNAADQAAARAATLHRADLPARAAWKGGPRKPELSSPPSCPGYPVDLSSFVVTGVAASDWTRGTFFELDSEAEVFQTAQMVREEWRIQVTAPGAVACLRSTTAKALAAQGGKLVSFKQILFPHVTQYSTAYRLVASAAGVRFVIEVVLLGRSRTEVTLTVTGLSSQQAAVSSAAVGYARVLAAQIKA